MSQTRRSFGQSRRFKTRAETRAENRRSGGLKWTILSEIQMLEFHTVKGQKLNIKGVKADDRKGQSGRSGWLKFPGP